jgi:hypothetical protein
VDAGWLTPYLLLSCFPPSLSFVGSSEAFRDHGHGWTVRRVVHRERWRPNGPCRRYPARHFTVIGQVRARPPRSSQTRYFTRRQGYTCATHLYSLRVTAASDKREEMNRVSFLVARVALMIILLRRFTFSPPHFCVFLPLVAIPTAGLLTRDARKVERKKAGRPKARKSKQWVKR